MICAQHNANGWYRCEIKGITKLADIGDDYYSDGYELDVFYVDFGDSAYIKSNEARVLLEKFNKLPCYGIQCTLHGIEALNDDYWSKESIDFFEDITHSCGWISLNAKLIGYKDSSTKKIPILSLSDTKVREK